MASRKEKSGKQWQILFSWAPKSLWTVTAAMIIERPLLLGRKAMTNLDIILKKQRHHFADKGLYSQSYGFSSSHVQIWELDHKEGWLPKNWYFKLWCWRRLESPLYCKEIKPVNPKENQHWIFMGNIVAEVEAPILWPPDVKNWLIGKDPDAGKDWRQEKRMTEDEMVRWHHQPDGHEFEQTLGAGEGPESRGCCSPWACKESDITERLNNDNRNPVNSDNWPLNSIRFVFCTIWQ